MGKFSNGSAFSPEGSLSRHEAVQVAPPRQGEGQKHQTEGENGEVGATHGKGVTVGGAGCKPAAAKLIILYAS
jgi:hypothetical protein